MPELKIYTVKDLREWLENNHPAEGLSERVIAPTRAWAIVHNPYVKDEDAIIAAIFEDGELAAYTASFPDMLEGKRVWWASTLYCYPKYTGKGYGLIIVGSLMEAHEPELTYDRWGAQETVEIFHHLGHQTAYTSRYHLSNKKIDTNTIKGELVHCAQFIKETLHPWPKPSKACYTLRYASYVDGAAYAFMKAHKGHDLWLREQDMLNWTLRYPLRQGCVLQERAEKDLHFTSYTQSYSYQVVKVYVDGLLQGVYVLRMHDDALGIVSLYYSKKHQYNIYASILDHILTIHPKEFTTDDKEVWMYVKGKGLFPKSLEEKVSFSIPASVKLKSNYTLQLGDGDSFA